MLLKIRKWVVFKLSLPEYKSMTSVALTTSSLHQCSCSDMPCAQLKASCKEASSVLGVKSTWVCRILTGSMCHMYTSKTFGTAVHICLPNHPEGIKSYLCCVIHFVQGGCATLTVKLQLQNWKKNTGCGSPHSWRHLK